MPASVTLALRDRLVANRCGAVHGQVSADGAHRGGSCRDAAI